MKKTIHIDLNQVIATPNPRMWGVFYEEINHAGDGGLYAEMIRNRSFADANLPEGTLYADGKVRTRLGHVEDFDPTDPLPGWTLDCGLDSIAVMDRTTEQPRNPECASQLRLSVLRAGDGVRVVNAGFYGVAARPCGYHGMVIARGEGIATLRVGLMRKSGIALAVTEIALQGEEFVKYPFELDCGETDHDARFFVEVNQAGTLYLDFVSLFPNDTYGGKKFGFRKDIVQMLKDLKPGFIRFPGGCVVEGIDLENAIHWKKTRGPIEDRPGHWDLWSYRCTDGLGMLEFCELAELLDAEIMYVVNCGMSCQFRQSESGTPEEVDFWLQNALDGIEYICGDVNTKYGALRAADGHPEPFRLKYVEIGNENWGEEYFPRYRKFYKVLKEKYPQFTYIANCNIPDAPLEMVDDHYYTEPRVFPQMFDSYADESKNNGARIYIGEYACNAEVDYGNLTSAVSEATFMVRMENRSDYIRIASYAPLLCQVNDRKWPVNLINYDNHRVFGLPSYYVQKLFSNNSVEKVVANDNQPVRGDATTLHVTTGCAGDTLVIKVANFGPERTKVTFCLNEGKVLGGEAHVVASAQGSDTNSLFNPLNVAEVVVPVQAEGNCFDFTLQPCSFAVLRLKLG